MEFPTLYGEASTGKRKVWSIAVEERRQSPLPTAGGFVADEDRVAMGVIITTHGYDGGKMQVNEKAITAGKNIGRSNETTPVAQAISEARASWTKRCETGYAPAAGGASASVTEGGRSRGIAVEAPAPMLAHDFNKRGHNIKFPCYVQRKYDGTRCIAIGGGLFSRMRKAFPNLEHIKAELAALPADLALDGELYSDTLTFQEIVGMVRRETLKDGDAAKQLQVQFHVYDIVSDQPYEERLGRLQALMAAFNFRYIKLVKTEVADSVEDVKRLHVTYVSEGYEGIMLRNADGRYAVGARSADLQKYKEFLDSEYKVVGYKEGEGLEAGCVIWLCQTAVGQQFACRPRGTREERQSLFANGPAYIGKPLTVRYQELTDEGLPRFPVGIAFRDYE